MSSRLQAAAAAQVGRPKAPPLLAAGLQRPSAAGLCGAAARKQPRGAPSWGGRGARLSAEAPLGAVPLEAAAEAVHSGAGAGAGAGARGVFLGAGVGTVHLGAGAGAVHLVVARPS
jgi:hypothetical protein